MYPRPLCTLIHFRTSGVAIERLMSSRQSTWISTPIYRFKYGNGKLIPLAKECLYSVIESKSEVALQYKPEEGYDFAQWVFSADGLPNLQVLVLGSFSYGGRYSKYNIFLCRSENGYRTLTPSEVLPWGIFQDNMDMLAACPFHDIME